jgi:hypothetical protein
MAKTLASKFISFGSGALAAPTSIKTSVATSASPALYVTTDINGAVGLATFTCPRTISATLASHASSYVNNSKITVTGLDDVGTSISDILTITGTGGNKTITGTKFFMSVVSIAIEAQADTLGAFTFGQADAVVNANQVRVGVAGDLTIKCRDAANTVGTIYSVQIGEAVPVEIAIVYASSTAQAITAYI